MLDESGRDGGRIAVTPSDPERSQAGGVQGMGSSA